MKLVGHEAVEGLSMFRRKYQAGDWVVYRKTKFSPKPGPRARDIDPAEHGDDYTYHVDKFWIVLKSTDAGRILLKTRRGKTHEVNVDDPNLRPAHWWERLIYRHRFPSLADDESPSSTSSTDER